MKSLIRKPKCPVCDKPIVEKSRLSLKESTLISLECGHMITEAKLDSFAYQKITLADGRELMPYQVDGVKFAERAGANLLIGDEQGLGKTIQTIGLLNLHPEELLPAGIVTKSAIKQQWMWEVIKGTGSKKVQVLSTSKDMAIPGFDYYIITYDILKTETVFSLVELKTLVLDEVQAIKNHTSGRAKAVFKTRDAHKIEHVIGLSGTPIKNNAGEYFTILNLIKPTMFPSYDGYIHRYCDSYESFYGKKIGGLRNPQFFFDQTKDFIIRRTKDEVMKDLPSLSRNFFHVELHKEFGGAYAAAIKELEEQMYAETIEMTSMIAIMTKLRRLTGASKVFETVDFVTDFLLSTDRKIVIFVHHHTATNLLENKLNEWMKDGNFPPVLNLHSGLSGDKRADLIKEFREGSSRVLIASTLAAGEGLNLQFVSDAVMMERQWNPANEEQAEARFHRFGQKNPVTITYMIASDTIDEYFTELVEQKRAIVKSTLDNESFNWNESNLMMELAEVLIRTGKKGWKL